MRISLGLSAAKRQVAGRRPTRTAEANSERREILLMTSSMPVARRRHPVSAAGCIGCAPKRFAPGLRYIYSINPLIIPGQRKISRDIGHMLEYTFRPRIWWRRLSRRRRDRPSELPQSLQGRIFGRKIGFPLGITGGRGETCGTVAPQLSADRIK